MALVTRHLENNNDVSTIFNSLKICGYTNVVCHDIENIKQHFGKDYEGKEIFGFITTLQDLDFYIRYTVDNTDDKRINMVFFVYKNVIEEAERMPEMIIIHATYKTNSHRMTFVNIADTSNVTGKSCRTLKTFPIAGAWVEYEMVENYLWVLRCLCDAVWPDVKDNNRGNNLLPMMKGEESSEKRELLETLAEFIGKIALKCEMPEEVKKEADRYLEFAKENCKDQEKTANKKNWINMYVYKYPHFGNRTSNCAESAHASLKHSLGTSSGKLMTVTLKVKKWYQKLVDDCKCRLMTECLEESTEVVFEIFGIVYGLVSQ
ncbi:hypothetical protein PHYBLDRAFT_70051 [Phycomyces blakesleeanus NRRL 1555(-)]|uniref:MULE transposase domain-containing protein n=1 Tax=Phycomyces blakesleeanus (strain ATCC 8743b / DSM 1359 / FGSC 10004 / NBRC 33097 / NRRL 1555) TaxID=763407 RepID=A0A167M2Y5_PHYB8|nr:hypothetical protein PHYBLDRAFT_70051 [Phycomyces blakesleeanus NRRL 1555(-)]OAD71617.1 hypothetical protein PHYBLDRAFT_70051 [Phycomyces blakesleeanus NRRL 1555(-)]|eukprot:XP_018289657.1 hypothetical protein PHYBLDRAFT_70051 [Phycomyces blakesleeanus NRRL 1555(-)]